MSLYYLQAVSDSYLFSYLVICLFTYLTLGHFALCFQLLQASQFFMLDSLKRNCERLAAGHLDCENVLDTYAYAKVSI